VRLVNLGNRVCSIRLGRIPIAGGAALPGKVHGHIVSTGRAAERANQTLETCMSHYRVLYSPRSPAASKDRQVSRKLTIGMPGHTAEAMSRRAARRTVTRIRLWRKFKTGMALAASI